MIKNALFTLLVLAILPVYCRAQVSSSEEFFAAHNDFLDLIFFDPSDIYLQYMYKPSHQLSGQFNEAQLNYFYGEAAAGVGLSRDYALYADIEYTWKEYDFDKGSSVNVDDNLSVQKLDSILAFSGFLNDNLLFAYVFYPGLDSDYSHHLGAKDLNWTTGPVAAWRMSERFELHGGFQIAHDYWSTGAHPLIGLSYFSEDRRVHVNITAPFLCRVGYRATKDAEFYFAAWYADSDVRMFITRAAMNDALDSRVQDREVLTGLGLLFALDNHWTVTLEGGLSFADALKIRDDEAAGPGKGWETAPYISTALGFRFG